LLAAVISVLAVLCVAAMQSSAASASPARARAVSVDPEHRLTVPVHLAELPVPPTAPADTAGSCTTAVNPHGTGCVSGAWGALGSPGFFWDSHYVLLGVTFAGAPTTGPASVYSGPQVLLVRTDGEKFANGDAWKCLTCGVPADNEQGIVTSDFTYPPAHALPGDRRVLVGNGILQCGTDTISYVVSDPRCTPANTRILPIYWGSSPLGSGGQISNGREWRLSPDGVHLGWSQLVLSPTTFNEYAFVGRLTRSSDKTRYDLTNVSLLPNAAPYVVKPGNKLSFQPHQMIGEFRGWTSDGKSILGIQSAESANIDAWSTSLATGKSKKLTDHAEYTDPMFMSPNGKWLLAEQVLGSGRLDFISGMSGIPALTDQLPTTGYISGIRNNLNRRFFLPWLVSLTGKQTKSERVNAFGDPNWNAAADPVWLADSTAVVWAENFACGANPTPHQCADSTEPGHRNSRVMTARFPLKPSKAVAPKPTSDNVPWGIPYTQGQAFPATTPYLPAGTYTLAGKVRGIATVVVTANATQDTSIGVTYANFVDRPGYTINGTESVQLTGGSPFTATVTWHEDLTLSGRHTGTKVTSPDGFTLGPSVLLQNNFQPTGTMTTTIDGQVYTQPANGA
jgi:hypothetical protein